MVHSGKEKLTNNSAGKKEIIYYYLAINKIRGLPCLHTGAKMKNSSLF